MTTFQYLKQYIIDGYWLGPSISRTPAIRSRYQDHLKFVRANYVSPADQIKIHHFNYKPFKNDNGLVLALPTHNSVSTDFGVMTENLFPYDIGDGLTQRIFWSTQPRKFCSNHEDYLWFVNTEENRSIHDLWHAHIFFRKR